MATHFSTIKVRFGELDPYNHVNHAVYVAYLEAGRTEAMEAIGIPIHTLSTLGWNVVITDLEIKFRASAHAGETLIVETAIAKMGLVTSTWAQRILCSEKVLIEAQLRVGSVDLAGRPKRMTADTADLFRGLLIDEAPTNDRC